MPTSLFWFRFDLRVDDNPAFLAAVARGAVVPIYLWSPEEEGAWPCGAASRWWLHQSLLALSGELKTLGLRLIVRRGPAQAALDDLVAETGADAVFWNRRYEPAVIERDKSIKSVLQARQLTAESSNSHLLFEPWQIATRTGEAYKVFTPYWRACLAHGEPAPPRPAPQKVEAPKKWPKSVALKDLELEPRIDWARGIRAAWTPGTHGAETLLRRFLEQGLPRYHEGRDRPDLAGTSQLSPHLHFGEISPRRIWHEVHRAAREQRIAKKALDSFRAELGWREFAHHLLYHFPHTPEQPLRAEFASFPWEPHHRHLRAWHKGQTGFPIIDAGMRQLWTTGWMHNRVRMITASFLVKDLLIPWQQGAKWFWDTLVDADLANNTLGWQWTSGCGADAAPFFRVFNPATQGQRFDPEGSYVRRWVPELTNLGAEWIHRPDQAPASTLEAAGVRLGDNYPRPLVDHAEARKRALAALAAMR